MSMDPGISALAPLAPPSTLNGAAASLSPVQSAQGGQGDVDAVSKDFEAVFLSQMMGQMFTGDDVNSYFGGGTAGEVYKSYLMNEYGKLMAQQGGVGIAASVKQTLLQMQEVHA